MAKPPGKKKKATPKVDSRRLAREMRECTLLAQVFNDRELEREEEREREREERRELKRLARDIEREEARERERRALERREIDDREQAFLEAMRQLRRLMIEAPGLLVRLVLGREHLDCNQKAFVFSYGRGDGKETTEKRAIDSATTAALGLAQGRMNELLKAFQCPKPDCPKRLHLAQRQVVLEQRPTGRSGSNYTATALVLLFAIVGCPRGG